MRIVYIAHPISGKVRRNLDAIERIAYEINLTEPHVVPFAPYFLDCCCLNDNIPEERNRGIRNDHEFFTRKVIDEVRLYGGRISRGMAEEVKLALSLGIPVFPMCDQTSRELTDLINQPTVPDSTEM